MVNLSDIATVRRSHEDLPTFVIRNEGEPAIIVIEVVVVKMVEGMDRAEAMAHA